MLVMTTVFPLVVAAAIGLVPRRRRGSLICQAARQACRRSACETTLRSAGRLRRDRREPDLSLDPQHPLPHPRSQRAYTRRASTIRDLFAAVVVFVVLLVIWIIGSGDRSQTGNDGLTNCASPMSAKKSFLLRVDPALWADVERLAQSDLRSVNAEVEYLLRDALVRRGVRPRPTAGSAAQGRRRRRGRVQRA